MVAFTEEPISSKDYMVPTLKFIVIACIHEIKSERGPQALRPKLDNI